MDGSDGDGVPVTAAVVTAVGDRRRRAKVAPGVVKALLARIAAGESLRSVCADAAMPGVTTVCRWTHERRGFAAKYLAARRAAGGPFFGGRSTYCVATAQAIFERVSAGEALISVCRDPAMPVVATVYKWRKEQPEFGQALSAAMAIRAELLFEEGWDLAKAATPKTAHLTQVRLAQLRWHVGKLAPKKYGLIKATEAPSGNDGALHVYMKKFIIGSKDEPGRWSDEPAEHKYSMVSVHHKGPTAGQPLPPPAVIREPRSTWGPNATGAARGGAVEGESDGDDDSYWADPNSGADMSDEDFL